MLYLTPDEIEARLRDADPFGDERSLSVVRGELTPDLVARLDELPIIVIGHDVPDAHGDVIDGYKITIDAHPAACIALVQVLRGSEARLPAEQLALESLAYGVLQFGPDHRAWLAARERRGRRPAAEPVRVDRDGDELIITLADPERRNAYSAAMRDGLLDALALAIADPALLVRIRGDGPSFCAGGDLDEFGTVPDPASAHEIRSRRSVGRVLASISDRVTVEVHGACVGAGVELPAFAGHVIARPDATFRLPEIEMGLIPGAGGTASLPRRIGRQRTAVLAMSGLPLNAAAALEWGLVDEIASGS